ncbi:MAG: hypothetical protein IH845_02790 [Nanoarchaeota archaeon]|nr:hypothetical protein [Nanoarchaeota archaeon]
MDGNYVLKKKDGSGYFLIRCGRVITLASEIESLVEGVIEGIEFGSLRGRDYVFVERPEGLFSIPSDSEFLNESEREEFMRSYYNKISEYETDC